MLDPFKGEILRLLDEDPEIPGKHVLEILQDRGYRGGKSIPNEHLREVRYLFRRARIYQRTTYLPGRIAQWDPWELQVPIPVGYGHRRRGCVLVGALGYSRAGCGTLVLNKAAPDLLWVLDRGLGRFGAVSRTSVFDREGALCADKTARDPRPTGPLARYSGALGSGCTCPSSSSRASCGSSSSGPARPGGFPSSARSCAGPPTMCGPAHQRMMAWQVVSPWSRSA